MRRALWLIPLAALIAVAPLALGGPSCGRDFSFHLQSWIDAAVQLRHGALYPRWTFLAAYNAGEPRFIFYPPLSWELGGLLTLLLPFPAVPAVLSWIVLTIAGFTMHRLARTFATPAAALLAACLYLANPFMLFTLTTRAAFGELLAAAFCPLLFSAMLSEQPSLWAIGASLALLWLSNVPAAVLGTYLFALLAVLRLGRQAQACRPLLPLLRAFLGGAAVAFGFSAIYLLPALAERRLIHMADAFPPGMRPTDNLLLHRTLLPGRDDFLLRTEHIAAAMLAATLLTLAFAYVRARRESAAPTVWRTAGLPTLVATVAVGFLLTFLSAPLWRTLPALWAVQFPWRLLFVLGACLALALALALRDLNWRTAPTALTALALTAALALPAMHLFRETCEAAALPAAELATLERHHTPEPTDEYVPTTASLSSYRPDNPPFWLAAYPGDYAPGTTPNTIDTDPNALMPSAPVGAQLSATPLHFSIASPTSSYLIVNLEDYPHWRVARNGEAVSRLHRADGLIALALPTGTSSIDIHWKPDWDEVLGTALTLLTVCLWLFHRRRALARA
jgi:hypothetical protein